MLSFRLNLLSPTKKANLHKLVRFLFTKELLEITIFTCSFLAILHIAGWLILTEAVTDLAKSTLLVNEKDPSYGHTVRETNKLIKSVYSSGQNFIPLTPYLLEITNTLPNDIKITQIDIDRNTQELILDGTAKTRDALLAYTKILQSISWLSDVSTPPSKLFQKEDIDFEYHLHLKGFPKLPPLPKSSPTPAATTPDS